MHGLLIIDVQNDFLSDGALAVPHGEKIIALINQISPYFSCVVATQDWHPSDHHSFAVNHPNKHPYETIRLANKTEQILWPQHCVQGTWGAELHPQLNTHPITAIFRKGMNPHIDTYSAFYDNDHLTCTGLAGYLREKNIHELYICGLCADICVYYSIQDAITAGFTCHLLSDATCPFDQDNFKLILPELKKLGVFIGTTTTAISKLTSSKDAGFP